MQIPGKHGEATQQRPKLQPNDAGDLDFVDSLLHAYGILMHFVSSCSFGGLSRHRPGNNLSKIKSLIQVLFQRCKMELTAASRIQVTT